jgi:crossover junction endodeoxyribonuclease RuvC
VGISPKQFADLQERTTKRVRKATPVTVEAGVDPGKRLTVGRLLGIDPSLRGTGFGVIELANPHPRTLTQGILKCPANWEQSRCLGRISQGIRDVIKEFQPTVCAVEGLFFAQNLQTALIMGQARGAALAMVAEAGLEIYEISPRKVKQSIVGYGAAQKFAVAKMVQRMLHLEEMPEADAADALAIALAFAQTQTSFSLTLPKRV